jgi:hypothetical protein
VDAGEMQSEERNDLAFFISGTLALLIGAYILDGIGGFLVAFGFWALGGCALTRLVRMLRHSTSRAPVEVTRATAESCPNQS